MSRIQDVPVVISTGKWRSGVEVNGTATYSAVVMNIIIYLFTAIGLLLCGSGYFTCKQDMKFITARFKSGGIHEKYRVEFWNLGNYLSICL